MRLLTGLPGIKYAGLRFMEMTVKEAYENHYLSHSTMVRKMSLASFSYLKPNNIGTGKQTPMRGCKCEQCLNLGLIPEKMIGIGIKSIPKNHICSIEATWCSFLKGTKCLLGHTRLSTIREICQVESNENENEKNEITQKKNEITQEKNENKNKNSDDVQNHCTQCQPFKKNDDLPLKKCVEKI